MQSILVTCLYMPWCHRCGRLHFSNYKSFCKGFIRYLQQYLQLQLFKFIPSNQKQLLKYIFQYCKRLWSISVHLLHLSRQMAKVLLLHNSSFHLPKLGLSAIYCLQTYCVIFYYNFKIKSFRDHLFSVNKLSHVPPISLVTYQTLSKKNLWRSGDSINWSAQPGRWRRS